MNISFYSYKGGAGRTQLCANIAAYLCFYKQRKILLWDWDFEAPGLHRYFGLAENEVKVNGTLELLENHLRIMRSKEEVSKEDLKTIGSDNIKPLAKSGKGGQIDLIPAGNYLKDYSVRLSEFNWAEFLLDYDGAIFVEELKKRLKDFDYDYIFIDSRPGSSDYLGISNVLLPDVNIILISPNDQNFHGSLTIINQILQHNYVKKGYRDNYIIPILSRLDVNHHEAEKWTRKFLDTFSFLLANLFQPFKEMNYQEIDIENYFFEKTFLPYNYSISAGENLFFGGERENISPVSFKRIFANIAEFLEDLRLLGMVQFKELNFSQFPLKFLSNISMEQGKKLLEKAEEATVNNNVDTANNNYKEAIQVFKNVLRSDSNNFDGLINLGKAYLGQKRYIKAKGNFIKALNINENSETAWIQLSNCLFEMGDFREAEKIIKKTLEKYPKSKDVKYFQARILLEGGKKNAGLQLFNEMQSDLMKKGESEQQFFFNEIKDLDDN
ncbi:MAG: AAA family ATPase [Lewinellaceae bacterium]|nr:AAA family ATPase [Lewinellaceae bacterium]